MASPPVASRPLASPLFASPLLLFALLQGEAEKQPAVQIGKQPPALTTNAANWLNAEKPLSLEDLRGEVVLLEFSFIH
ncbi:MAG: hypothetical protein AB1486_12625 [Planctomycetota bacterium]